MLKTAIVVVLSHYTVSGFAFNHHPDTKAAQDKTLAHQENTTSVFIDPRDGKKYNTIMIGEQRWMQENLNYKTEGSWCYNQEKVFCKWYGRLYQWESAMHACPEGWKLPDNNDWRQLTEYLINELGFSNQFEDEYGLGNILKSCRQIHSPLSGFCDVKEHPRWEPNDINFGKDVVGFAAFPGGYRHATGSFADIGFLGHWWSSEKRVGPVADIKSIYRGYSDLRSNKGNANDAFSVRCIKQKETDSQVFSIEFDSYPKSSGIVNENGHYPDDKSIRVEALAEKGYDFVSWTKQGKVISTLPAFNFTMPANDVILIAHFLPEDDVMTKGSGVTDIDGNFYESIIIGDQEWMSVNLKTSRYADGTQIKQIVSDKHGWSENTSGAHAWYANDQANKHLYGALYNWHAVNNENGLCPAGWEIPTIEDFGELISYLGDETPNIVANKLKSCRQIDSPFYNDCATHEQPRWDFHDKYYGTDVYGFSALAGGKKSADGVSESVGASSYFWTATKSNIGRLSWYYNMDYNSSELSRNIVERNNGFSVRCIRDATKDRPVFLLDIKSNLTDAGIIEGDGKYHQGDSVFVGARTLDGFTFIGWADPADKIISKSPDFSFVMPANNLTITAKYDSLSAATTSTVSDIEGNVYKTITLGEQKWMAENLKTGYYRNGTPVNHPGDNKNLWLNNTNGAYAFFHNDPSVKNTHGALYNWYAVADENGICPDGWRVPAHDDWTRLEQYVCENLDHSHCNVRFPYDNSTTGWRGTNEGNALKMDARYFQPGNNNERSLDTLSYWKKNKVSSKNQVFGFNALPAGFRFADGLFYSSGNNAYWWTSTEYDNNNVWIRGITSHPGSMARFVTNKKSGFSIRCVRDVVHTEDE